MYARVSIHPVSTHLLSCRQRCEFFLSLFLSFIHSNNARQNLFSISSHIIVVTWMDFDVACALKKAYFGTTATVDTSGCDCCMWNKNQSIVENEMFVSCIRTHTYIHSTVFAYKFCRCRKYIYEVRLLAVVQTKFILIPKYTK